MVMPVMGEVTIERENWGKTKEGEVVELFTLSNGKGMEVRVMSYGATLVGVDVPDREGKVENVTLYLDSFAEYEAGHPLLGSIVGRFANRIDTGGFTIDGTRFDLDAVNKRTGVHIHGGPTGFQRQVWEGEIVEEGVRFTIVSADGHEGFPGEVEARVTYRLDEENALSLEYEATTSKPTHVNLTNHVYFNLAGAGSGDVLGQELTLAAENLLEFDERKIPTGKLLPVAGTAFDFRGGKAIGERFDETGGGYDHCYVLDQGGKAEPGFCARAVDRKSGRVMEVSTTQPGVQLYTANGMKETLGAGGKSYGKYHGFCLETQHYPNAPNMEEVPSTLLRPGEVLAEVTVFRFGVEN